MSRVSRVQRLAAASIVTILAAALGAAPCAAAELTRPSDPDQPDPIATLWIRGEAQGQPELAKTYEDEVMELVNQERWANGQLAPLKRNGLLDSSSETHSTNMAVRNFFAHCDLDTHTSPGDRITDAGYIWNGYSENIAAGYSTPVAVMAGWMASTGHRANILSTSRRELGIGYYYQSGDQSNVRLDSNGDCVSDGTGGPYGHYWTQNFGLRSSVYPVVINREAYETSTRNVNLYVYGSGWATQMRIRNESNAWTAWMPFSTNQAWQLSAGAGVKEVFVEITNGGTPLLASDTIVSTAAGGEGEIFVDGFESGDTSAWDAVFP